MLHILAVGPIDFENSPSAHAFLAHDLEDDTIAALFVERDAREALEKIRVKHPNEKIVVEPALEREGAQFGWASAPLNTSSRELRATFAIMLAHGHGSGFMQAVPALIDASLALDEAKPWTRFSSDDPLLVRIEGSVQRRYEAAVLGGLGQSFGVVLYPVPGSIARLVSASDPNVARDIPFLSLDLEREPEFVANAMNDAFGVALVPMITKYEAREPRAPELEEAIALAAAVEAISTLDKAKTTGEYVLVGPRGQEVRAIVEVPKRLPFAAEVIRGGADKVGRNDLCPCGSGRKYKRCCLAKDKEAERTRTPESKKQFLHELDRRLVDDQLSFVQRKHPGLIAEMINRLLGVAPIEQDMVVMISVVLYHLESKNGVRLLDQFIEERGRTQDEKSRDWLEKQRATWLSVWEVLSVDPGRGMILRDLLTGEERDVLEAGGSESLAKWDCLLGRVVDVGEFSLMVGMSPHAMAPDEAAELVEVAKKKLRSRAKRIPIERMCTAETTELIWTLWYDGVRERAARPPAQVLTTDGDHVLATKDHFALKSGAFARVASALKQMPDVSIDDEDDRRLHASFLREGNAVHKTWSNTVIAGIDLSSQELICFTLSVRRADELRSRLEASLKDDLRFKARIHTPFKTPPIGRKGPIYFDTQKAKVSSIGGTRAIEKDLRRNWLSETLDALGGLTPREAAKKAATRRKLDTVLKAMEYRAPPQVEEDVAWLRDELGVAAGGAKKRRAPPKMSDTLVEFVDPILVEVERGDVEEFQEIFELGAKAWNAVLAIDSGSKLPVSELREQAISDLGLDDDQRAAEWFDSLFARKRELFADDRRIIGSVLVEENGDGIGVRTVFAL